MEGILPSTKPSLARVAAAAEGEDMEEAADITAVVVAVAVVTEVVAVKEVTEVVAVKVDMETVEDTEAEADAVRVDMVMVDLVTREAAVTRKGPGGLRSRV